jgi:hypothetical protein
VSTPAHGLCGHWEAERRTHCDDTVTRRFLQGWRCPVHAPGATDAACPHGVAWTSPCPECERVWA